MNWTSLLSAYAPVYAHHSDTTRYLTERWLERFQAWCEAQNLAAEQVLRSHLDAFQAQLLWMQGPHGQLFTSNTVYQGVRMVRAFLRWAVAQGHVPVDPTSGWILPRPQAPQRILKPDEVKRLLSADTADTLSALRNRAMLAVLVGTGLRTGEFQRLTLDDVDVEASTLVIRYGKLRTLHLAPPLMDILATYLAQARPRLASRPDEAALFVGQDGRPLSRARVNRIVQVVGREVGIAGVTPVALRYTYAAQVRTNGADEKTVRLQLGIGKPPQPPAPPPPKKPKRRLFSHPERRRRVRG